MHLFKAGRQIIHVVEGAGREHDVLAARGDRGQVGHIALMELDGDVMLIGKGGHPVTKLL